MKKKGITSAIFKYTSKERANRYWNKKLRKFEYMSMMKKKNHKGGREKVLDKSGGGLY